MIYTFDTKNFLLYPVIKDYFKFNDSLVYETIQDGFKELENQLKLKNIKYKDLKGALVPTQDKEKNETCFVFDTKILDKSNYGYYIFEKLIPLLDKESTYSILYGDYVDFLFNDSFSQKKLRKALNDVLVRCHESKYQHSTQYFLIYINRLTGRQRLKIVEGLYKFPWFTGFADVTYNSVFKSYLSYMLMPLCIKNKNRVIMYHTLDYLDNENINICGYPFENYGFTVLSINMDSFQAFLRYKIESIVPDKDDISFSLNALFPKFASIEQLKLKVSDNKWNNYLADKDKDKKGKLIELLKYKKSDKERFIKEIYKKICANYIYNLRKNEFGDLLFNICIELPTINNHLRKTMIALKYNPDEGVMEVVTIT